MENKKIEYIVTAPNGCKYTTMAVSERDAINNVHYKVGLYTDISQFSAVSSIILKLRRLTDDERRNKTVNSDVRNSQPVRNRNKEEYVQLSLPW